MTTSDEYFKEYVSLGGQKNRQEYDKNIVIFFEEADGFIDGNPIKHKTRGKAGNAVMKKAHISEQEYNLMFESVDNITSYT